MQTSIVSLKIYNLSILDIDTDLASCGGRGILLNGTVDSMGDQCSNQSAISRCIRLRQTNTSVVQIVTLYYIRTLCLHFAGRQCELRARQCDHKGILTIASEPERLQRCIGFHEVKHCMDAVMRSDQCSQTSANVQNLYTTLKMMCFKNDTPCDRVETSDIGYITSPYYPSNYPSGQSCNYRIQPLTKGAILIRFVHFETESASCRFDYVQVDDGTIGEGNNSRRFCGTTSPGDIVSSSGIVTVYFRSDGSVARRGFMAVWIVIPESTVRSCLTGSPAGFSVALEHSCWNQTSLISCLRRQGLLNIKLHQISRYCQAKQGQACERAARGCLQPILASYNYTQTQANRTKVCRQWGNIHACLLSALKTCPENSTYSTMAQWSLHYYARVCEITECHNLWVNAANDLQNHLVTNQAGITTGFCGIRRNLTKCITRFGASILSISSSYDYIWGTSIPSYHGYAQSPGYWATAAPYYWRQTGSSYSRYNRYGRSGMGTPYNSYGSHQTPYHWGRTPPYGHGTSQAPYYMGTSTPSYHGYAQSPGYWTTATPYYWSQTRSYSRYNRHGRSGIRRPYNSYGSQQTPYYETRQQPTTSYPYYGGRTPHYGHGISQAPFYSSRQSSGPSQYYGHTPNPPSHTTMLQQITDMFHICDSQDAYDCYLRGTKCYNNTQNARMQATNSCSNLLGQLVCLENTLLNCSSAPVFRSLQSVRNSLIYVCGYQYCRAELGSCFTDNSSSHGAYSTSSPGGGQSCREWSKTYLCGERAMGLCSSHGLQMYLPGMRARMQAASSNCRVLRCFENMNRCIGYSYQSNVMQQWISSVPSHIAADICSNKTGLITCLTSTYDPMQSTNRSTELYACKSKINTICLSRGGQWHCAKPYDYKWGTLYGSGYLTSPNYPGNYPNNAYRSWTIRAWPSHKVRFTFIYFSLEQNYDYLQVKWAREFNSGRDCDRYPFCKYTGTGRTSSYHGSHYVQHSKGRTLMAIFTSDGSITKQGFKAQFTSVYDSNSFNGQTTAGPASTYTTEWASQSVACNGVSFADFGEIKSPGYPYNYPPSSTCTYSIQLRNPGMILLYFKAFNTEYSSTCRYDYLEVWDGYSSYNNKIGKYCGTAHVGKRISSTGTSAYLRFRSDGSIQRSGFWITWINCIGMMQQCVNNGSIYNHLKILEAACTAEDSTITCLSGIVSQKQDGSVERASAQTCDPYVRQQCTDIRGSQCQTRADMCLPSNTTAVSITTLEAACSNPKSTYQCLTSAALSCPPLSSYYHYVINLRSSIDSICMEKVCENSLNELMENKLQAGPPDKSSVCSLSVNISQCATVLNSRLSRVARKILEFLPEVMDAMCSDAVCGSAVLACMPAGFLYNLWSNNYTMACWELPTATECLKKQLATGCNNKSTSISYTLESFKSFIRSACGNEYCTRLSAGCLGLPIYSYNYYYYYYNPRRYFINHNGLQYRKGFPRTCQSVSQSPQCLTDAINACGNYSSSYDASRVRAAVRSVEAMCKNIQCKTFALERGSNRQHRWLWGRYLLKETTNGKAPFFRHEVHEMYLYASERNTWVLSTQLWSSDSATWVMKAHTYYSSPVPWPVEYLEAWDSNYVSSYYRGWRNESNRFSCDPGDQGTFYPFGPDSEDDQIHLVDGVSTPISSESGMRIFGALVGANQPYFIFEDGYISLNSRDKTESTSGLPRSSSIIAPYFCRQDATCTGTRIFHHHYNSAHDQDNAILKRASRDVATYAHLKDFLSTSVIVITWYEIYEYPCRTYSNSYYDKRSTYQLVLITDDSRTFALLNYRRNRMNMYPSRRASIGYNILGKIPRYWKNYLSGSYSVGRLDSLYGNKGIIGQWLVLLYDELSLLETSDKASLKCIKWWQKTRVDATDYKFSVNRIPCPCYMQQIKEDRRFRRFRSVSDTSRECYRTNRRQRNDQWKAYGFPTCCYNVDGALLTDAPDAGSFYVSGQKPSDKQAHDWCCRGDDTSRCRLFFDKRPPTSCDAYQGPLRNIAWGDPHIRTIDGKIYSFNGIGEYWMVQSTNFWMQARTKQTVDSSGALSEATVFVAFAAKENNTERVHVEIVDTTGDLALEVGNSSQDPFLSSSETEKEFGDITITKNTTRQLYVEFPSGWAMQISVTNKILSIITTTPRLAIGQTRGLLGVYNDDKDDDFTAPNGNVLPTNATDEEIFHQFGKLWQIKDDESLFVYSNGKSYLDYKNDTYVPTFTLKFKDSATEKRAQEACGDNQQCMFDFAATNDESIAMATKELDKTFTEEQKTLSNRAPTLSCPRQVNVTVGMDTQLQVTGSDPDNDTFSVTLSTNIAIGYSWNPTTGVFVWKPLDSTAVFIRFTGTDSSGGSSSVCEVKVVLCNNCSAHGSCDFSAPTQSASVASFSIAQCLCDVGWIDANCSNERDGCASKPCQHMGGNCTDLSPDQEAAQGVAFDCGGCQSGFQVIGGICTDIDECENATLSLCHFGCTNTEGSFQCTCPKGYRLDATKCTDVDECEEGTSGCSHMCSNEDGGFTCICYKGYQLKEDNRTCLQTANATCPHQCQHICNLETGVCTCKDGYTLAADKVSCEDKNECQNSDQNRCEQKNSCFNTEGGYNCSCDAGYKLNQDGRTCDECGEGTWGEGCANACDCEAHAQSCDRRTGCICNQGWAGKTCEEDINECNDTDCGPTMDCIDNPGFYICMCKVGYQSAPGGMCVPAPSAIASTVVPTQGKRSESTTGSVTPHSQYPYNGISETPPQPPSLPSVVTGGSRVVMKIAIVRIYEAHFDTPADLRTVVFYTEFKLALTLIFGRLKGFSSVAVLKLWRSSVAVQFVVHFSQNLATAQVSEVVSTLQQQTARGVLTVGNTTYSIAGIPVIYMQRKNGQKEAVNVTGPCSLYDFLGTCGHGGTCLNIGSKATCRCKDSFEGEFCDLKTSASIMQTVIPVAVVAGVVIIVLLVIIFILIKRSKSIQKKVEAEIVPLAQSPRPDNQDRRRTSKLPDRLQRSWQVSPLPFGDEEQVSVPPPARYVPPGMYNEADIYQPLVRPVKPEDIDDQVPKETKEAVDQQVPLTDIKDELSEKTTVQPVTVRDLQYYIQKEAKETTVEPVTSHKVEIETPMPGDTQNAGLPGISV